MKKTVSAILLIIYLGATSGIAINLHYCMNRFDSIQLGATKTEICGKCGMHTEDANGCCHDEVKIIKLQDDQQSASLHYQFISPEALAVNFPLFVNEPLIVAGEKFSVNNHSPPLSKQDTYLQNCVFRI